MLNLPCNCRFLAWGFADGALRFGSIGSGEGGSGETRLLSVHEHEHFLKSTVQAACFTPDGAFFVYFDSNIIHIFVCLSFRPVTAHW